MNQPTPEHPTLAWPPLLEGVLLRRYKRFLADIRLPSGTTITAHCPNSGRMTGCAEPERPVFVSRHDSPRRKLKYTWELIDMPTSLVGVNTQVPNRLVAAGAEAGTIPELVGYPLVRREVRVADHSRLDVLLESPDRRPCYVEVKNCTLVEDGVAMFPDAVTTRGRKHLHVLEDLHRQGNRSVLFLLVQRMDAGSFAPAGHIDPTYANALGRAAAAGVEVIAYDTAIDLQGISLRRPLPVRLPPD